MNKEKLKEKFLDMFTYKCGDWKPPSHLVLNSTAEEVFLWILVEIELARKDERERIIGELEDLLVVEDGIEGKIIKHKHLKQFFKQAN